MICAISQNAHFTMRRNSEIIAYNTSDFYNNIYIIIIIRSYEWLNFAFWGLWEYGLWDVGSVQSKLCLICRKLYKGYNCLLTDKSPMFIYWFIDTPWTYMLDIDSVKHQMVDTLWVRRISKDICKPKKGYLAESML